MKKILYGCVALTVLITAVAIVELNKKPAPVASPDETAPASDVTSETAPDVANAEDRTYSESEDQIQQAFENYIYFKGMDKVIRTDVRADGKDFIITITNPSDVAATPQELRLTRVDDFAGKPQYKLNNTSLFKWQALASEYFENPTIASDTFSEDIAWVPDLGLVTNQALKVSNISVKDTGFDLTVKSMVSDMLVTAENDKMNIAGSSDITDLKMLTPGFVIQVPHITQSMQMNGANQTGNLFLQLLTAQSATSSLNIPILGIGMASMPGQPIMAQLASKMVFADNISMDTKLSNIKITKMPLPMLPDTITSNVTVEGVSKEMLIAYMNMREQLEQQPDEESVEAKELGQKLVAAQNQILKSLSLKINQLSFTNPNAGIDVTGIVHYAEPAPTVNARIAVTNFDVISPKAPPVDETACKAALANTPEPTPGSAPIVPAACVQQSGLLEGLRPYLASAEHTLNDKGQSVDTFSVIYSAGSLSINNQPVLTPEQKPAAPGNDLPLGTDAAPASNAAPNAPAVAAEVAPMAEVTPAAVAPENNVPAVVPETIDNTSSVADLMAQEIDETVVVDSVSSENVAPSMEAPTQVPAPTPEIAVEEVDTSITEEVVNTPLEPAMDTQDVIPTPVVDTPIDPAMAAKASLPTAPVVDPVEIVEAQKLLDAAQ